MTLSLKTAPPLARTASRPVTHDLSLPSQSSSPLGHDPGSSPDGIGGGCWAGGALRVPGPVRVQQELISVGSAAASRQGRVSLAARGRGMSASPDTWPKSELEPTSLHLSTVRSQAGSDHPEPVFTCTQVGMPGSLCAP